MKDLSRMREQYFLPKELSIHFRYTYQGREIDKMFFDEHQEIQNLYPPKWEIENKRREVLNSWKPGSRYTIFVSEKGIQVRDGF